MDYSKLIREYVETSNIDVPAGSITELKGNEIANTYLRTTNSKTLDQTIEDARQGIIKDWCSTYIERIMEHDRLYHLQQLEEGMEGDYYQCYEGDYEMRNLAHCSERLQVKVGSETYSAEDIEDLGIDIWEFAQYEAEYMTYSSERPIIAQTRGIGEIEIHLSEDGHENLYGWMRDLDPDNLEDLQNSFSCPEDFDIEAEEILLYVDMSYRFGCAYLDLEALTTEIATLVANNEEPK